MNATAHPVAPEDLMAWLDGELSSAEAQAVSAHLKDCAECAGIAAQFRETAQSLAQWTAPPAPSDRDDTIMDRATKITLAHKSARPARSVRFSVWNWRLWAIGGAGAVTALFAMAIALRTLAYRSMHSQALLNPSAEPAAGVDVGDFVSRSVDGQPMTDQKSKVINEGGGGPLGGRSRAFEPLLQIAPGAAPDSNGLFHGLGDHVQSSFGTGSLSSPAPAPMIARTVSLTLLVKDFAVSRPSLDAILARHRGYSAQLNVSTPENAPRGLQASLRIPAPELISAVGDLKTLGRVENEAQSGEEVTQQHTDLVARLKTARDTEARFETILQQRTGNVGEVLQVEEGIARVRGEIESMEAEQKALEHRVDFATIDLQLTEEYKAQLNSSAPSASNRVHNAFIAGIRNAAGTMLGIVLFIEEYCPPLLIWLLILGLPVILFWRRYRKMRDGF